MKKLDLIGKVFERLTVIKEIRVSDSGSRMYLCLCVCGTKTKVASSNLRSASIKSCGCLRRENSKKPNSIKHGLSRSRVYCIWRGIKARCTNKNNHAYKYYGGRNITICDRWLKFENFLQDMGLPKHSQSIDRIDNNGPYSKENCRWATSMDQMAHTRMNRFLTYEGKTLHISEWARLKGINKKTLSNRIDSGWSIEKALANPIDINRSPLHRDPSIQVTYKGRTLSTLLWAREIGISHNTLHERLKNGWSIKMAFTTPTQKRNFRIKYKGRSLTLIQWSSETNISEQVLRARFRSGWAIERALTEPVKTK